MPTLYELQCFNCNKNFTRTRQDYNESNKHYFCSSNCYQTHRSCKEDSFCTFCNQVIPKRQKRHTESKNKFCNRICLGKFRKKDKSLKPNRSHKEQAYQRFLSGLLTRRSTIRNCLIRQSGNQCAICTQKPTWLEKPLVLIVDHIDGNSTNNNPSNLRLICPNCNSQTATFSGRNKGLGRKSLSKLVGYKVL